MKKWKECLWLRVRAVLLFALALLVSPLPAQQPPSVADLPALTNLVNSGWATNQFMAKAAPPGLPRFNHDLGIVAAGGDFFTNLPFVVSLDITNYPLTILETNTSPRTRIYLDATGVSSRHWKSPQATLPMVGAPPSMATLARGSPQPNLASGTPNATPRGST